MLVLLVIAAVIDWRQRRIPNWLNAVLILSGLIQSILSGGLTGLGWSLAGLFAAAAIPFVLFAIGALGAGDVKLMAGIGAWMGPLPALWVFIVEKVVGLVLVFVQALAQRRLKMLLHNSRLVALNLLFIREVGLAHVSSTGRSVRSIDRPLPYAVPALIAVIYVLATWPGKW
jgi:prepilin peptidase CpaA